jgi:AbrB family looped-hinge helix DNA binding protein
VDRKWNEAGGVLRRLQETNRTRQDTSRVKNRLPTISKRHLPMAVAMVECRAMGTKISIDKAGRVVLPKALREKMHVEAGDDLLVEAEGDRITLRPIRQEALLKKELGVWVYQGESSNKSIPELIEAERERRVRESLE